MKRILSIIVIVLFAFVLFACKDDAGKVKATLSNLDVTLDLVSFKITIEDPEEEITGAITLSLYDSNEKLVHNKDIADLAELDSYSIGGLNNEITYTLKLVATIGRKSVVLIDKEIILASSATVHITTKEEFLAMSNNRSGNYVLDNDIDFENTVFTTPFTSPFSGTFDGQGHTVKNVVFDRIIQYTGIFGYISSGVVKNVNFDNIQMGTSETPLVMSTSSRVGIISGYLASSTGRIENINITNSGIYYSTSSTVQAYVGGIVGESRGQIDTVTLDTTVVSVKSTSYGRIRVGGAVGLLGEDAQLKNIISHAEIDVEIAGSNIKDRENINLNVGGVIGFHNAKNVNRSVENIVSTGDITVDIDYGTIAGTTKGSYSVYVGGLAGIAYSNINQAIYSGSITVNHEKNENETSVSKNFFIGGLYGHYLSSKNAEANLRISDSETINIHVSDDVALRASQIAGKLDSTGTPTLSYYGDLGLMINDIDESLSETLIIITTFDEFFDSEFIENYLLA